MAGDGVVRAVADGDYSAHSDNWYDPGLRAALAARIDAAIDGAVAAERERCARVAEGVVVLLPAAPDDQTRAATRGVVAEVIRQVAAAVRDARSWVQPGG